MKKILLYLFLSLSLVNVGFGQSAINLATRDSKAQAVTAFISSSGSDATGVLGSQSHPFLTIDAGLDALPSTSGRVKIGIGTFGPVTASKIKNNTIFEGSGRPTYNATITVSSTPTYTYGTPSKLIGGTIINGGINGADRQGVEIRNLGCDNGSDWVTVGGHTETNGISFGSANGTAPFTLQKGIVIENVVILGSAANSSFHGIVLENCIDPIINNVQTWFATHGIALKIIGGRVSNVITTNHFFDGIIIKSDTYAYSKETNISGVRINSSSTANGGIVLQDNASGLSQILLSDISINNTAFGIKQTGTYIDEVQMANIKMKDVAGIGISFSDLRNSRISNCIIGSTGIGVSVAGKATWITNCTAPSISVSGYSPAQPLVITDNFSSGNITYTGSYVFGGNNYGSTKTGTISPITDVAGSSGGNPNGDLAVGDDLTFATRDANVTVSSKQFITSGTSGTTFTDNALEATLTLAASTAGRIIMHCPAAIGATQSSAYMGFNTTNNQPTNANTYYAGFEFTGGGQIAAIYGGAYNTNGTVVTPVTYKSNYWYAIYRTAAGGYSIQESGDGSTWTDVYVYPTVTINSTAKLYVGISLYTDAAAVNKIFYPKANGLTP